MMRVGILLFDDVEELDFAGPLEVFGAAGSFTGRIEIVTISRHGSQIQCRYGLQVQPNYSFSDCPPLDLLIVRAVRVPKKSRMIPKQSHLFANKVLVPRSSACVPERLFWRRPESSQAIERRPIIH